MNHPETSHDFSSRDHLNDDALSSDFSADLSADHSNRDDQCRDDTSHDYNSKHEVLGPRPRARTSIMDEREDYGKKFSLIITDQCNIACAHCLPECTGKESFSLEWPVVRKLIEEAADNGIETICFTGGEPFLKFDVLQAGIHLSHRLGLKSTVMTNGYWASSRRKARAKLEQLSGLTRLGISTDVFHQVFVPVNKVINGVLAAHELGIYCGVRLTHLKQPDQEIAELQEQLASVAGLYELEHQPVQPLGRAEHEIPYEEIFSYDVTAACCRSADVHAVNPNGCVTACCGAAGEWEEGHPLSFGNVHKNSVDEILDTARNSQALHAVRLWGSSGLLKLAMDEARRQCQTLEDPEIHNLCELCRFTNTDEKCVKFLNDALEREDVRRSIRFARLKDLGETF